MTILDSYFEGKFLLVKAQLVPDPKAPCDAVSFGPDRVPEMYDGNKLTLKCLAEVEAELNRRVADAAFNTKKAPIDSALQAQFDAAKATVDYTKTVDDALKIVWPTTTGVTK